MDMYLIRGQLQCVFLAFIFGQMSNSMHAVNVMEIPRCRQATSTTLICNIVPRDIPENVTHVYLQNVKGLCNIQKQLFEGSNWERIKLLHFSDTSGSEFETCQQRLASYALYNLIGLEELAILSRFFIGLENNSFAGLGNLKSLSFTGCMNLRMESITRALVGKLPKLEVLSMNYTDIYHGIHMDKEFFDALTSKPIKHINMNNLVIKQIALRHAKRLFDTLEVFNMSRSTVEEVNVDGTESMLIKHLKVFDVSYSVIPMDFFGFVKYLPNSLSHFYQLHLEQEKVLSQIETVNVTGVNRLPIKLDNITVYLSDIANRTWYTEHVILQHNQLIYIDVTVPCNVSSLKTIDMSHNSIEFLQPNFCPCCSNLIRLNLMNNQMFKMASNNFFIFANITKHYTSLKDINLAQNRLVRIPKELFLSNKRLRTINLSQNLLEQIAFQFHHLDDLEEVDLQRNQISILDKSSLKNLKTFEMTKREQKADNITSVIYLDFNPLSCSTCRSLNSITWLAESKIVNKQKLTCTNENGQSILIDQNAANMVKDLCNRPRRTRNTILISVLTPLSIASTLSILFCLIKRYRNKQRYKQRMEERIQLIQQNEMDMRYLVFLSFSSYDDEFVMEHISSPLKEQLRKITKTGQELVCMGDMHFQPGKPIQDEMVLRISESAVFLLILSPEFCSSEYGRMEFDYALQMNKPIILMVKDEIDPNEMVPSLREIFYTRTRILWERHDGNEYRLKTTWENICTSILELMEYN